jgi:hypothetical protein
MNDSALLTKLLKRNAVRRAAQLPLLDLRTELHHAIRVARWREACEAHADDLVRLRQEVVADLQLQHGDDFGQSAGGRWQIEFEVSRRFKAFLLAADGVQPP